ncbi:MAG: hypothetical protein M1822_004558 [Bathelium mastoideum]|nr:MAG: hypothetical protein M1822_004558 [Bathelium mastoideum]
MTSKFFTWTKGERRNAKESLSLGGLVSTIDDAPDGAVSHGSPRRSSISRMKSPKLGRKPKPLTLVPPQDPPSLPTLPSSSLTLQDAAVNSATNLLAVVNEILWSPPLSATGAPRSPLLSSLPSGRPRSHTAPPTPNRETSYVAELPGSLLQENEGYPANNISQEKIGRRSEKKPLGLGVGLDIDRPHTVPQEIGVAVRHKRSVSENGPTLMDHQRQDHHSPLLPIQRNLSENSGQLLSPNSPISNNTRPDQMSGHHSAYPQGSLGSQSTTFFPSELVKQEIAQVSEASKPGNRTKECQKKCRHPLTNRIAESPIKM